MSPQEHQVRIIRPQERPSILGGFVRFKLGGEETGGAFALVEHTLAPGILAAPIHTHTHEDEASFVLEGEIGAQIGDEVMRVGAGALLVKPRGVRHSFWNPGASQARVLELIWPAGFERYFAELDAVLRAGPPDPGQITELAGRYGMTMAFKSIPELLAAHGVRLGG
jgi:quercetin dioxygenase-like cupin family protein